MSFRVIRVSEDYQVVVVVTPHNASLFASAPGGGQVISPPEGTVFYEHNPLRQPADAPFFTEISLDNALIYSSGHADGLGWGKRPQEAFTSLDEVERWTRQRQEAREKTSC